MARLSVQLFSISQQHDIREADISIRQAYKMYYRYKSSALETTFSQLIDDDGFDLPLDSDQSLSLDANFSLSFIDTPDDSSSFLSNFSNLDDVESSSLINIRNVDENHVIKEFEAVDIHPNNEKAWGSNLNNKTKKAEANPSSKISSESIRKSMTEKLFPMANFSKRNPRKSLSRSNLQSNSSVSSSFSTSLDTTKETLPDLETILALKAQQEKAKDLIQKPKLSNLNLDKGWLNRVDDSGTAKMDTSIEIAAEPKRYGLSNITPQVYAQCTYDNNDQSDEVIENSEDESTVKPRNVRHVLKKRKVYDVKRADMNGSTNHTNETSVDSVERVSTEKIEPVKKLAPKKNSKAKQTTKKPKVTSSVTLRRSSRVTSATNKIGTEDTKSDTDPFADDSHSDPEFQPNDPYELPPTSPDQAKKSVKAKSSSGKRRGKKLNKKAEENVDENATDPHNDRPEDYISQIEVANLRNIPLINIDQLKQDTALFHEYVNSRGTTSKPQTTSSIPVSPTKRDLEREKLEKKIAAGKLNENFVRIDVRKKVFVRGKKTINYSKYKKSKWKKQKAANALAGPDMDMRGCDGGFLVCHNCGQQGHFAQDCKIHCKFQRNLMGGRRKMLKF